MVLDLTNPSPGLGWSLRERMSLSERGPADLLLALGLIHHLAIGNNLPLDTIADWLCSLGHGLVVEFIPREDSQVARLLANLQRHLYGVEGETEDEGIEGETEDGVEGETEDEGIEGETEDGEAGPEEIINATPNLPVIGVPAEGVDWITSPCGADDSWNEYVCRLRLCSASVVLA